MNPTTQSASSAADAPEAGTAVHALLSDGTTVLIRASAEADKDALAAMFAEMSEDSFRMRFFTSGRVTGERAAERLAGTDPDRIVLLTVGRAQAGHPGSMASAGVTAHRAGSGRRARRGVSVTRCR